MQNDKSDRYLIIGLGNPGREYDATRHNIGFRVVRALAHKYALSFRSSLMRVKGSLAEGVVKNRSVLLLLPLTYMNESGASVRRCVDYYKIPLDQLIVVVDDVALPLGEMRLRLTGSAGGHNGLKSIEAHLGTQDYSRLRIGVGDREEGSLSDHVLGRFTEEEERQLPDVVESASAIVESWLTEGAHAVIKRLGDKNGKREK